MVDGEDEAEAFAGGEVNEGGVGEIHRAVGVLRHEGVDLRQFLVGNDGHDDRAGVEERPNGAVVMEVAPEQQMERFGEDGLGGQPRKAIFVVGFEARFVPLVAAIDERENSAGINKADRRPDCRRAGATCGTFVQGHGTPFRVCGL